MTPASVVALVVLGAAADGGAATASATPARATWVWDEATVLDAAARRDLLAFARSRAVDTLFVHAAAGYEEAAGFEALAQLVDAAGRQGASITLVAGDPSWALAAHHADALAVLDRARRIEAQLAGRGLPRGARVLFDVEPYLLPDWRTSPQRTAAAYVDLLRALRDGGRAAGLDVWNTIPFWFPKQAVGGRPLDALVLDASAGIVVMAYRNRAEDVEAIARPILDRAAAARKPVIVAVETVCIDPPRATFCGQTAADLAAALDHMSRALGASPALAGLAVHKYASWAALGDAAR